MQATPERSERLIYAVLAAQVAAIRDRMDTGATADLLWRTVDLMSELSGLVLELSQNLPSGDALQTERCSTVLAAESEITRSLENVAFQQVQYHDATRQMADCVVTVLQRMAAVTALADARPSPGELAELYVSEEQRRVHAAAADQFDDEISLTASQNQRPHGMREGSEE